MFRKWLRWFLNSYISAFLIGVSGWYIFYIGLMYNKKFGEPSVCLLWVIFIVWIMGLNYLTLKIRNMLCGK